MLDYTIQIPMVTVYSEEGPDRAVQDFSIHAQNQLILWAEVIKHYRLFVRLEGHSDERGTNEYNQAIGERYSKVVADFLLANGASPSQLEIISYGEDRPKSYDHDESAWLINSRVEIRLDPSRL